MIWRFSNVFNTGRLQSYKILFFHQIVPVEEKLNVDFFSGTVSQKISNSKLAAANEKEQMKARKAFYQEAKVNENYLKICEFLGNF